MRRRIERTYRNFVQFDQNLFYRDLCDFPWQNILLFNDVDTKVQFFTETILALFDIHAPFCTSVFTRPPAPWITYTIREMMRLRDRALNKFRARRHPTDWVSYKELRNLTNSAIRREKRAYLDHCSRTKTAQDVWKGLRLCGAYKGSSNVGIPAHLNNATAINNYFISSVDVRPVSANVKSFYNTHLLQTVEDHERFNFHHVTEDDLMSAIMSIRTNAAGVDGITIKMMRLCCPFILPWLAHLVNFCVDVSVFPRSWKTAITIPVPKKPRPELFSDLRPIAILPILSKIIEKVLSKQLLGYLNSHNILPDMQSGFRPGFSCATALTNVIDDIVAARDLGQTTALILLDYSKAFDMLNLSMLCAVLHYIGLDELAVSFLASYLGGRSQCVVSGADRSGFLDLRAGVPQGSVLGPLLYVIYVINFRTYIKKCKLHLYADDTQLYYSFPPCEGGRAAACINEDLEGVLRFSGDHGLKLNVAKTSCILFGPAHVRSVVADGLGLRLDGLPLSFVDATRNLGVIVDAELRFRDHVGALVRGAFGVLKMLYTNRAILNADLRRRLCDTLVLSRFNFCDVLYGPFLDSVSRGRIQRVQNSCLRFIYGVRRGSHISCKLMTANWLSMENRRACHRSMFYFRVLTDKSPPYLFDRLTFRTDIHNIGTRFRGCTLSIPRHNTQLFKRSFSYLICMEAREILCFGSASAGAFRRYVGMQRMAEQCRVMASC